MTSLPSDRHDGADRFIDREDELAALRRLTDRNQPTLILVYGRRRVGKTFLLDHAWRDRRVFYFLAADTTALLNRQELLSDLATWSGTALDLQDYPTWRTVFRLFVALARQAPLIVVLDEFQYLLDQEDDVASQLAAVWDRDVATTPLMIALSGSEVATMERLQDGSQPLYGRPSLAIRIRPFDYWNAARMLPHRTAREHAILYGVFGGTPRYLASAYASEALSDFVADAFLSPWGDVHLQVQHIIEQEKGIRRVADYRAVLAAVAVGKTELNDVALAAGLQERPHVARRALAVLEALELVWRERNFAAPEKAPFRYRIADHAVRFWYRFIHANRSRLETGDPKEVWNHEVFPFLNGYMGKVFERICAEAYRRRHAGWSLPDAVRWSRWEGHDRNRRPIELDLVAQLDDGQMLTGEIKWSSRPIEMAIHRELMRNLDDLARSGQRWAGDALTGERSAGFLYFSAAGFSAEFREQAATDTRLRLISLEDLYDGV